MANPGQRLTKCFLFSVLVILLCPVVATAAALVWDESSGTVAGYIVYWGTHPSDRSNSRDVGNNTRYDLANIILEEGVTYYLCVSAYNEAGESPPCMPVVFTPGDTTPPTAPIGLTTN